jgi:predicted RNA-binding protein Jag
MMKQGKPLFFEGQDIHDAIRKAVETLQVQRETIDVKVVSEERK